MSQPDDRLVRRAVEAAAGRDSSGPCPEAEVLGLYAERGLDGDEHRLVETHVAGCARCQAMVAAMVRSAPESAGATGAGAIAGGLQGWWAGWRWLAPVTATAAVVMLAVWVGRGPSEQAAESARVQAGPAALERAPVPPEPVAPPPAPGVTGSDAAAPRPLREELKARVAEPEAAPSAPAVGALADAGPPATAPAVGAAEVRQEQAKQQRQRDEARRDVAAEQFRSATTPPPASPAVQPPPPPSPTAAPAPAAGQETIGASPAAGAAVGGARDTRTAERNQAAAAQAMAKAVASSVDSAGGTRRMAELTGRVTYRTRQALPPGTTIEVRLLDTSRVDALAEELARTVIVTKGEQVPVPFAVPYDANAIDARRRYTLQATITIAGRVAFRTTAAHPVLTSGAPATNVEVVVEPQR